MPRKKQSNLPLPILQGDAAGTVLRGLPPKVFSEPPVKRRYSVTADVLSYLRCRRQYGFFSRRGYTSAQSGQLFFGTVIHETLDRAHAHYRGEVPDVAAGTLPTEADIESYFGAAESALRARGIRPLSKVSRDAALGYVQAFNQQEGPGAYPRIIDTEHRLEKDQGTYILHGVVDVVAGTGQTVTGGRWDEYEIWDYKGSRLPKAAHMKNYEFQMSVYAHLYEGRNGVGPRRAVLWFLGESGSVRRHEVDLRRKSVAEAVELFSRTVAKIEESIRRDNWSRITRADAPGGETCSACDLRWNCPAVKYRLRGLRAS